jgi:hypothetical protein
MLRPSKTVALAAFAFLVAVSLPARAEAAEAASPPSILDDDPAVLLGLGLTEALSRFGPPASVAAVRGEAAWQDDVAFLYRPGYSLFMYDDRLWQLRFTKPYEGSLYGLFMGDPAEKALSVLGQPYESGPGFLVFRMPYVSFPVRLRLGLQDDRIADAYLYRADF